MKQHGGMEQNNLGECMRRLALLPLLICLSASAATAGTLETIAQKGTIRIGYIADEAPFSSKKKDGGPTGYAIDLCGRIAEAVAHGVRHLKRTYVETTLAEGFDAVKTGSIDLLCGATTVNLNRRATVDFSQPIFLTGASALLRRDSPDYLQVLFLDKQLTHPMADASTGSTIGVRADTTTGATLRDALGSDVPQTRIADFPTHEDGLKALEDHKIDAYFADSALLISLIRKAHNPAGLEMGTRLFTHEPYAIAVRRDDSAFRLLVDRTLTQFYLSDAFPALLKTYFGSEAAALRSGIVGQSIPE
jgi:polar amino acid transport system substrate-binding protein/glutamate/aspartate transport system substrate-binding protein